MTKKSLTHAPGFIAAIIVGGKRYVLNIAFDKGDEISFDYAFLPRELVENTPGSSLILPATVSYPSDGMGAAQ